MANETTGRESDKFMLRLPDGMRERLKSLADTNNRSMNAEIVARLQASLDEKSWSETDHNPMSLIVTAADAVMAQVLKDAAVSDFEKYPENRTSALVLSDMLNGFMNMSGTPYLAKHSATERLSALENAARKVLGKNITQERVDTVVQFILAIHTGTDEMIDEFNAARRET